MQPEHIAGLLEEFQQTASGSAPDLPAARRILRAIAGSGEPRTVIGLLPGLALTHPLAREIAEAIDTVVRTITPAQLAWLDEASRTWGYYTHGLRWDDWRRLPRDVVRACRHLPGTLGVLACHPSGYVRQDAVEALGAHHDGREIPFLALRANDWVEAIAGRAQALLGARLAGADLDVLLPSLPFLLRLLDVRRRDQEALVRQLTRRLLEDNGVSVLARIAGFHVRVRRRLYALLLSADGQPADAAARAALADADPLARREAARWLAAAAPGGFGLDLVVSLVTTDPVPGVRKEALLLVETHAPSRIPALLPDALVDEAGGVRETARFLARQHGAVPDVRSLCVAALKSHEPDRLAGAIAGLAETGATPDAPLVEPHLDAASARVRRATLRALATFLPDRASTLALRALGDPSSLVRRTAATILLKNMHRVDAHAVKRRIDSVPHPRTRASLLPLLAGAPKWESAILLLEMLGDPNELVRRRAVDFVSGWTAAFNSRQVAPAPHQLARVQALLERHADRLPERVVALLRFSVKPSN